MFLWARETPRTVSALIEDGNAVQLILFIFFMSSEAGGRFCCFFFFASNSILCFCRISRPDQVVYNDKVSEVKDIIAIGPAVKNILTVSQLENTVAYMSLLLAETKSFLSSSQTSFHGFSTIHFFFFFFFFFFVIVKEYSTRLNVRLVLKVRLVENEAFCLENEACCWGTGKNRGRRFDEHKSDQQPLRK